MNCRILFVDKNGNVEQDTFKFKDRARPIYRALLAYYVAPGPLGITSQALSFMPSYLYPLIYPFITGILGLILTAIGFRLHQKRLCKTS